MLTDPALASTEPARGGSIVRPSAASVYLGAPASLAVLVVALGALDAVAPVAATLALGAAAALGSAWLVARRPPSNDHMGVVAFGACVAALTAALLQVADTRQGSLTLVLALTSFVAGAASISWVVTRRGPDSSLLPPARRLLQPFEDPVSSWGMALVGAGLALPLVGTYSPSIAESDSAWLVVSTQHVRAQGLHLLQQNQDVLLPHLLVSPMLAYGGYAVAVSFTILCTIALTALTAVLAHRLTGSITGTLVAVGALLSFPELVGRADRLPMYALMLVFGYGAAALLHRAMGPGGAPRWVPIAAGVCLMLCLEAHSVGQLFLMLPFLMLILHPWARARRPLAITLVTMIVVGIPRLAINLSVGGITAFRSNYTDFMIQKGYLRMVNRDFWGQNVDVSPIGYLRNLPTLARSAFGQMSLAPVVILGLYATLRAGRRARAFGIAAAGSYVLALSVASPGTYGRYLLPLSIGGALAAGAGATRAHAERGDARTLSGLLTILLLAGALTNMGSYVGRSAERHRVVFAGSWPVFANLVDDDKAVLGVRSHELVWTDPTVRAEFSRTLSEADFVTYLTWPDDKTILDMMHRIGAGWIFILSQPSLETDYHQTWVGPTYGLQVRHVRQVALSDEFCLVAEIDGRRLYRVGGCPGGYLPGPWEPADLDGDGVPDALEPRLGLDDPPPEEGIDGVGPTDPGSVDGPEGGAAFGDLLPTDPAGATPREVAIR